MKIGVGKGDAWFDLMDLRRRDARRGGSLRSRPLILKRLSLLFVKIGLLFVVLVVFLKASLVEAFFVPSSSMTPTLEVQDYILVPKFLYGLRLPLIDRMLVKWSKPKLGDVVVFTQRIGGGDEETSHEETVVKRVIAMEGDVVEIFGRQVYWNGMPLVEPYAQWSDNVRGEKHVGPYRVPPGKLFVLGDNRDNSDDSRTWDNPFVSISKVLGRAVIVYWSERQNSRIGKRL